MIMDNRVLHLQFIDKEIPEITVAHCKLVKLNSLPML